VTDDTTQSKYCVMLFLNEVITQLKQDLPHLESVQIFSDGCTGQFKNRWILSSLAFSDSLFGVNITWNFSAFGHGKGTVDGVGAIVKRTVRQRVLSRRARVYSAQEFHDCVSSNINGISSTFMSCDEIKLLEFNLSPRCAHS
jgi:hypothetical protein